MAPSASSKWITSLLMISSAGLFISIALAIKVHVIPAISASSHLILPFNSVLCWLKPPYLYLIVNGIIIAIAAVSRFQFDYLQSSSVIPPSTEYAPELRPVGGEEVFDDKCVVAEDTDSWVTEEGGGVGHKSKVSWKIPAKELTEVWPESLSPDVNPQPPSVHQYRRSISGTSIVKPVTNILDPPPNNLHSPLNASMEETWKAIRAPKMTRHLSRRDTWQDKEVDHEMVLPPPPPPPPVVIRKEPSLSQDELNRRVEAFIEKFNQDMRMQRQRSLEEQLKSRRR